MFVHQFLGCKSETAAALLANVILELVVELLFARLQGVHFNGHFKVGRQIPQLDQIGKTQRSVLTKLKTLKSAPRTNHSKQSLKKER